MYTKGPSKWYGLRALFAWYDWRVGIAAMPIYGGEKEDLAAMFRGEKARFVGLWFSVNIGPLVIEWHWDKSHEGQGK